MESWATAVPNVTSHGSEHTEHVGIDLRIVDYGERKFADITGTELVPWAGRFQCFQIKYAEAILSNSTQKLLCFEITKMLIIAFRK